MPRMSVCALCKWRLFEANSGRLRAETATLAATSATATAVTAER